MDISRRLFVKTTAVALASAAAAGTMSTLVGCAGGGQTSASADGAGETYLSVCRFCGCGCGVICRSRKTAGWFRLSPATPTTGRTAG